MTKESHFVGESLYATYYSQLDRTTNWHGSKIIVLLLGTRCPYLRDTIITHRVTSKTTRRETKRALTIHPFIHSIAGRLAGKQPVTCARRNYVNGNKQSKQIPNFEFQNWPNFDSFDILTCGALLLWCLITKIFFRLRWILWYCCDCGENGCSCGGLVRRCWWVSSHQRRGLWPACGS